MLQHRCRQVLLSAAIRRPVTWQLASNVAGQRVVFFYKGQLLNEWTFDHAIPKRVALITH
jgi:hypothetical protein